jgi:hypothetical protein
VVEPSNQYLSQVLPDGNGGLHVLWTDYRSGGGEIFAHHILAGGALDPAWISNGNPVAAQPWTESSPVGCSDGAGGLIVSWLDVRDGAQYDVYATRVLPGGAVDGAWPANGVAVSTASNNQQGLVATGDGQSGALFAFTNAGTGGLYAMRVARFGVLGLPEPLIASVKDVPNDEGGRVGVSWYASWLDTAPSSGLYGYDIYRALSSTAAQSALLDGAVMLDGFAEAPAEGVPAIVRLPNQTDDYFWEYAGTVNATHFLQNYGYTATTSGDSTGNDNPRTAFMVVARTFSGEYWPSPPDSGYSVDNLAPVAPAPFTGTYDAGSSALEWEANSEPDLAGYRLYRGKSPGFAIGPASFVAEQTDLEYVDVAGEPFYYKLVAFDSHGNVSAATPLLPSGTVDAPQNSLPRELALAKPAPNPAAGPLTLRWALARSDHATLALFDASGRRVRVLFDGTREAGFHESRWDLRDDVGRPVPPGLYVASLASGGAHRSQRIAVTR